MQFKMHDARMKVDKTSYHGCKQK